MNYEQKYKEALERAKNLRKDAIDMGENIRAKQCEIIFPELKESDDEKIRRGLINGFNECLKSSQYPISAQKYWHNIKIEDIFSWLEKQGEQKPTEWDEEDDYNLQCMIAKVTSDIQKGNVGRNNELIDWLKSLKQKIKEK